MSPESADGRRAKGERRRRAIVEATLRVVERDGVGGVSHRGIAREAGVPTAAIGYYFDGIDDLLVASLLDTVESMIGQIGSLRAEIADGVPVERALAARLAAMVREFRDRTLAEYELYLLAARRPALRSTARRWIEVTAAELDPDRELDPGRSRALFAALDGLLIQGLIADEPPSAAEFEPALRVLLPSSDSPS